MYHSATHVPRQRCTVANREDVVMIVVWIGIGRDITSCINARRCDDSSLGSDVEIANISNF